MKLTPGQKVFADNFLDGMNQTQAYMKAYPNVKKPESAKVSASRLLTNDNVLAYINSVREELQKKNIATKEEIFEFWTRVMRGEIKDQFGLEAPLSERNKASESLAKRMIDIKDRQQETGGIVIVNNIPRSEDK